LPTPPSAQIATFKMSMGAKNITFVIFVNHICIVIIQIMKTIAERLAFARGSMTQSALAAKAGVSQGTIGNIESGARQSKGSLPQIAEALNINHKWLATGEGQMEIVTASIQSGQAQSSRAIFTSTKTSRVDRMEQTNVEDVAMPVNLVRAPVVGTARMGEDGHYEEIEYPVGHGDGWVDAYSSDPNVYALRVKGDSMHPAIRHGSFVVVEPNGQCVPGEYVVLAMVDGRKMVKELVINRPDEIVIESVNGNHRKTIEKIDIEKMHPVAAIVPASKWRSN